MTRRPLIRHQVAETVLGVAFLAAGCWILYDAHEARGLTRPWWMRPLAPF